MKPTWIYEHGVFGTEEQPEADELFVAALRKHGLEVLEFDRYSTGSPSFYSNLNNVKGFKPFTYIGSFRSCRAMGLDQPVGIDDWSNYNCSTWLTHFGEFALNSKYFILSLAELHRRKKEILEYFGSPGGVFLLPYSGLKQFHGGVVDLSKYQTLEALTNYLRQGKGFKVLVAPAQTIRAEYRFFFKETEVVTGSSYKIGSKDIFLPAHHKNGSLVSSLAQSIAKKVNWYPSPLWSLDLALNQADAYVVELGSYHCAGVYASDLDKYIEAANDFAIKMSNEDDN